MEHFVWNIAPQLAQIGPLKLDTMDYFLPAAFSWLSNYAENIHP